MLLLGFGAVLLSFPLSMVQDPSEPRAFELQDGEVAFLAPRQTVWLHRSQVIPFTLADASAADQSWTTSASEPGIVGILDEPQVLAGESIGYLRVRGLAEGETELRVGTTEVSIRVRTPIASSPANQVEAEIVSPVPGAVVWGSFSVGVRITPGISVESSKAHEVRLRLPDGTRLAPQGELPSGRGPYRRLHFLVDTSTMPSGALELIAEAYLPKDDRSSDGDRLIESEPIRVRVLQPDSTSVFSAECEAFVHAERLDGFGSDFPRTGSHPDASDGSFVANDRPYPIWLFPYEVEHTARYQMMVVARGDFGAGAFPSVGFCVDDPNQAVTSSRLVARNWQRIPIGHPVLIEAGQHTLAARFLNDSQVSHSSNRNLYLDRFELLRVDDAAVAMPELGDGSGASMTMDAMMGSGSTLLEGSTDVWIGFDQVLHGLPVNGRLLLRGHCNWQNAQNSPAPQVRLLLNGQLESEQQAAKPVFVLDCEDLEPGANRVRMIATLADGSKAETPEQTVWIRDMPAALEARAAHRFSVLNDHWNEALRATLSNEGQEVGHRVAKWTRDTRAELSLPEDLEGEFEVFMDARGPDGGRYEELELSLLAGGESSSIGTARIQNWWSHHPAGRAIFTKGPKTLRIVSPTLGQGEDTGESSLWIRDVILRTPRSGPDRLAPRADILYPRPGHEAWHVDAVVVEAWDDEGIQSADVLIDGQAQGTHGRVPEGVGHLSLPLLLRHVPPGAHELAVRVVDREGNVGESRAVAFTVAEEAPPELGPYLRAIHLLNRLAYGPDPRELAAVLTLGEEAWLADRLSGQGTGDESAQGLAQAIRGKDRYGDINRGTLSHVLRTNNPVHARFSFWADNHFSTWIGKTTNGAEWWEHWRFHELGFAPFSELLLSSATSPVMIYYLDQAESYAGSLNENYAREVMELHTLGVDGGYDQEEVTTLAGLLCGLTLAFEAPPDGEGGQVQGDLQFDPDLGDARERQILGMRFERCGLEERYDRFRRAIELLAAHPSTARYVTRKLVEHYVAVPAPEPLVEDLSRVFLEEGGDMAAMITALARHPLFWKYDEPRMTSPFDFAVRLGRATDVTAIDWALSGYLRRSGMSLHDHVTPDGYPQEDSAWVDTNGMLQRWRLAQEIPWALRKLVADPVRNRRAGDQEHWRQRVVDLAAVQLTGWTLSEESNQAALDFLAADDGPAWQSVDQTVVLVCRLPEANMK